MNNTQFGDMRESDLMQSIIIFTEHANSYLLSSSMLEGPSYRANNIQAFFKLFKLCFRIHFLYFLYSLAQIPSSQTRPINARSNTYFRGLCVYLARSCKLK